MNEVDHDDDEIIELLQLRYVIDCYGDKCYQNEKGHRHRIYGPAVINQTGTKFWYKNDLLEGMAFKDGRYVIFDSGYFPIDRKEFINFLSNKEFRNVEKYV